MLISPAYAQAAAGGGGADFSFLIMMVLLFMVFYFLLIRPQQKKQKDHENLLKAVGKGDRVVTTGGIHGVVVGEADDVLTVEIANLKGDRVRIKVDRGRIDRRVEKAKGEES